MKKYTTNFDYILLQCYFILIHIVFLIYSARFIILILLKKPPYNKTMISKYYNETFLMLFIQLPSILFIIKNLRYKYLKNKNNKNLLQNPAFRAFSCKKF